MSGCVHAVAICVKDDKSTALHMHYLVHSLKLVFKMHPDHLTVFVTAYNL